MVVRKSLLRDDIFKCVIRDGGICQKCHKQLIGTDNNGCSLGLELHHIIPVSEGGDDSTSNLITFCHECHMKEHGMRSNQRPKLSLFGGGYHVCGDKKNGYRIAIPIKALKSDRYRCIINPDGSLLYVPVKA